VTVVTGVYLMFYYRPTAEYAYADMKYLEFDMPFGMLMRNMHRWAAHGMVIAVWLHMFRVFMTGSYKPPREFNWVVGVILLVLTLLLSFTGYLLPWDQLSIWAVTVGSNMARATPLLGHDGPFHEFVGVNAIYDARAFLFGGAEIGPHTLLRFYILHCIFFPLLASLFMAVHFWRIRRDGMSGPL
jgi:quinol-cytochrome oxidoreductase complex cytochrome b subunit